MAKEQIQIPVWDVLKKYYPEGQYALLEEVRDKAGHYASRAADFIAVGLWPSRGLHVTGIELKSSRNDWRNEMKNPAKAENIFQYCDFFYLLTKGDNIAKLEEIPANWGWMSIEKNRIVVKKDAPKLQPKPVTNHFLSAIVKRASDKTNYVRNDEVQPKIEFARETERGKFERTISDNDKSYKELESMVIDFERGSGINIRKHYRWQTNPEKIGNAVKIIQEGKTEEIKKQLTDLENTAYNILSAIQNCLKVLNDVKPMVLESIEEPANSQ